jgi:hypothetical protein
LAHDPRTLLTRSWQLDITAIARPFGPERSLAAGVAPL